MLPFRRRLRLPIQPVTLPRRVLLALPLPFVAPLVPVSVVVRLSLRLRGDEVVGTAPLAVLERLRGAATGVE